MLEVAEETGERTTRRCWFFLRRNGWQPGSVWLREGTGSGVTWRPYLGSTIPRWKLPACVSRAPRGHRYDVGKGTRRHLTSRQSLRLVKGRKEKASRLRSSSATACHHPAGEEKRRRPELATYNSQQVQQAEDAGVPQQAVHGSDACAQPQ